MACSSASASSPAWERSSSVFSACSARSTGVPSVAAGAFHPVPGVESDDLLVRVVHEAAHAVLTIFASPAVSTTSHVK